MHVMADVKYLSSSTAEIANSVRFVVDADRAFLLDIETGAAFTLNEFGARVWERLVARASLSAIASEISGASGVSLGAARDDLEIFLRTLVAKRLIRLEP